MTTPVAGSCEDRTNGNLERNAADHDGLRRVPTASAM